MTAIPNLISTFLARPSGRYLLVGGSVYALELAIILLAQCLGANDVVAVSISFSVGLVVSFALQKIFTFGDKRLQHRILLPQIVAVGLLIIFNFGFTVLVTKLLSGAMPAVVSRTLALCVTTIWNFYLYKTRIFKDTSPQQPS